MMHIMKNTFTHLINSRHLTTFNSSEPALKINKKNNYLFDLSYLSVIYIKGEKSQDFLQGQVTCDVRLVSDIQMIQGAQCNLKGRILSLFDIINWNGFKLVLPEDLSESTLVSLSKTAQLSRVSIQKNSSVKIFGFYLQNKDDLIPNSAFLPDNVYGQAHGSDYCYYHLGNGFYIFIVESGVAQEFSRLFAEKNQILGSLTWHTLRLYEKQIEIYPESRGLFLPHRLDLHQTQYISFDKGCYKGQEIIARTHYRATLKHELNIYIINTEQNLYSGQKIFQPTADIEQGELIDYSPIGNDSYLIAVSILKNAAELVRFEGHDRTINMKKI